MFRRLRELWWSAARLLAQRAGSKPVGIWVAWLALAYAAGVVLPRPFGCRCMNKPLLEGVILWAIFIAAALSLWMRRLIARAFCGMAFAFLLREAAASGNWFGIVLAPVAFLALVANRRWFDERLPNIE